MTPAGLQSSILAATQASLSVLLVISYGAIAARTKLLEQANAKVISKLCVQVFLPLLIIVKIGSELHVHSISRYGVILLWALSCHLVSFLIGITGHAYLRLPRFAIPAIMFNNTTAYPLLLIESLDATGILQSLIITDETTVHAIERARSYFLVFATVSNCLTFAVGPRLMATERALDPEEPTDIEDGSRHRAIEHEPAPGDMATEETGLLQKERPHSVSGLLTSNTSFPARNDEQHWMSGQPICFNQNERLQMSSRARRVLVFLYDFINAPLIGAMIGAIIGLSPPLQKAFFNSPDQGGFLSAWLTVSWRNVGGIFVPLPLVVAGVSLYTAYTQAKLSSARRRLPWFPALFVLAIRFIVWPLLSIFVVRQLVSFSRVLGDDPMLWFAMMLMPAGPPAMKLITMVQVSNANEADEHIIAKLLTASYIISPIFAFTVVGALTSTQTLLRSKP